MRGKPAGDWHRNFEYAIEQERGLDFHRGPRCGRNSACHQETVWPWLIGPYVTAYRKVHGRTSDWTGPFRRFVEESSSQIPEVFDSDAPHRPGGCL